MIELLYDIVGITFPAPVAAAFSILFVSVFLAVIFSAFRGLFR